MPDRASLNLNQLKLDDLKWSISVQLGVFTEVKKRQNKVENFLKRNSNFARHSYPTPDLQTYTCIYANEHHAVT